MQHFCRFDALPVTQPVLQALKTCTFQNKISKIMNKKQVSANDTHTRHNREKVSAHTDPPATSSSEDSSFDNSLFSTSLHDDEEIPQQITTLYVIHSNKNKSGQLQPLPSFPRHCHHCTNPTSIIRYSTCLILNILL